MPQGLFGKRTVGVLEQGRGNAFDLTARSAKRLDATEPGSPVGREFEARWDALKRTPMGIVNRRLVRAGVRP